MMLTYEACVTSVSQARRAVGAGAHRLELCARIDRGGLTPPAARIVAVRAATALPVHVMIRRDRGDFRGDAPTLGRLHEDIAAARRAGADGLVLGVLSADRTVDLVAMQALMKAAGGLPVTFHRAFDLVPDPLEALEALVWLGVRRILTSGGARTALEGTVALRRLVDAARGRIGIIAAGTVRADHVARLVATAGVREVHAHLGTAREMQALAGALRVSSEQ